MEAIFTLASYILEEMSRPRDFNKIKILVVNINLAKYQKLIVLYLVRMLTLIYFPINTLKTETIAYNKLETTV